MSGDILGTAAYMSPEQARGDSANLTSATDVYSLGAILYELLTGRPPFVGVQPLEVLGQVISDEPIRPSQLVRRVPKDIQTICLKCLEKAPGRRYGSAASWPSIWSDFLTDQPIVARHTSSIERELALVSAAPCKNQHCRVDYGNPGTCRDDLEYLFGNARQSIDSDVRCKGKGKGIESPGIASIVGIAIGSGRCHPDQQPDRPTIRCLESD